MAEILADLTLPFTGGQVQLRIAGDTSGLPERERQFILDLIETMTEFSKTVLAARELPVIDLTPRDIVPNLPRKPRASNV